MAIQLTVSRQSHRLEVDPDTPLLWVLRDELELTGTKYGCGINQCGACTVHLDGRPTRSCTLPVSAAQDRDITTIEGGQGPEAEAVQKAWRELDVPQCGYCQSGQVMAAVALLRRTPSPADADIDSALAGNVCRCATYLRIRQALHQAAARKEG